MATEKPQAKKITLRDRKKAQPDAQLYLSEAEKKTIANTVAKKLDEPQRNIFFYTCQALGLNPLLNQICAVPYKDGKTGRTDLSIQVMRDGFLTIAHRSGKFAGMKSGVKKHPLHEVKSGEVAKTQWVGWAKVYHKDFKYPVYQEADFAEYDNSARNHLWKSKPKTMIKKVAESMALRKAFNVSGVYATEEMELEIARVKPPEKPLAIEGGEKPATEEQITTIKALDPKVPITTLKEYTRQEAAAEIRFLSSQKKGKK